VRLSTLAGSIGNPDFATNSLKTRTSCAALMSKLLTEKRIHIADIGPPSRRTRKLSLGPPPGKTE